jgi:hypothetical protein
MIEIGKCATPLSKLNIYICIWDANGKYCGKRLS